MVMVEVKEHKWSMDGFLNSNLNKMKEFVRKDWDALYIVDGEVGSGKSVFAQQLAYFVSDGKFDVSKICFNPKQFRDAILSAEKYTAVIFDEAFRGLSGRAAMTQTNRIIVSLLNEIRQKNLFVFIVLPSIWDLDQYVGKHRCRGLFHVYTSRNKERGFFSFFAKDKVMSILRDWKNRYKYPVTSNFRGRFPKYQPINVEEYVKKKQKALGYVDTGLGTMATKWKDQRDAMFYWVNKGFDLNPQQISEKMSRYTNFPMTRKAIANAIKTKEGFSPGLGG